MKAPKKTDRVQPSQHGLTPHKRSLLAMSALCLLTLAAYANSFAAGFTLDNRGLLLMDPRIRGVSAHNLGLILTHTYWWPYGESGLYRPFTTLTYLFNFAIMHDGGQPAGYHSVNFLLHAANVLLVYVLARRLLRVDWRAFFVAAIWAVHPVLTESVTNMVGRADLLAGAATLGGLWLYLKSAESTGRRKYQWLAALMLTSLVGVFSKESAVMLPAIMVLYEVTWWSKRGRALLLGCLAIVPALVAMVYQRSVVFSRVPNVGFPIWDNPLVAAPFWQAKLTALAVAGRYVGQLLWPVQLSCDYSYAQIPLSTGSIADWAAWITVAAIAGVALFWRRRQPLLFFAAAFAFLTWLPSSNLLFTIGTIRADRFLYLPAIGLAFGLVSVIGARRWAPVVLGVIALLLTARTAVRNLDWHDDLSLARATVAASPHSYKSHMMLADALYVFDASHANIAQVVGEAEQGIAMLELLPDGRVSPGAFLETANYNLVQADALASHGEDARPRYQRALQLLLRCKSAAEAAKAAVKSGEIDSAKLAQLQQSISYAQMHLDRPAEGLEAAAAAVQLDPFNPRLYGQKAAALLAAGKGDEAAVTLVAGTLVTSDMELRQQLVVLYQSGGDTLGCAVVRGPNGPALNPNCETVRRHTCLAAQSMIPTYQRLGRQQMVAQLKDATARGFGCVFPR